MFSTFDHVQRLNQVNINTIIAVCDPTNTFTANEKFFIETMVIGKFAIKQYLVPQNLYEALTLEQISANEHQSLINDYNQVKSGLLLKNIIVEDSEAMTFHPALIDAILVLDMILKFPNHSIDIDDFSNGILSALSSGALSEDDYNLLTSHFDSIIENLIDKQLLSFDEQSIYVNPVHVATLTPIPSTPASANAEEATTDVMDVELNRGYESFNLFHHNPVHSTPANPTNAPPRLEF